MTGADTKRPLIFLQSGQTTRFGDHGTSQKSDLTFAFVLAFAIVSFIASSCMVVLKGKYSIAFYSIVSYLQLLLLTPLIGITIGVDVERFYDLMDFILFNFNFLSQDVVFTEFSWNESDSDFFQSNKYLTYIGLESASAIVNIGQLLTVGLVV